MNHTPSLEELSKEAHEFVWNQHWGVLSTISKDKPGHPYGSVVKMVITPHGHPFFLLSDLAEHVQNISIDPRCALTLLDGKAIDPTIKERISLEGQVRVVSNPDQDIVRFFSSRWKDIDRYLALADFRFYQMTVKRARYIGGFGKAAWLPWEHVKNAAPHF